MPKTMTQNVDLEEIRNMSVKVGDYIEYKSVVRHGPEKGFKIYTYCKVTAVGDYQVVAREVDKDGNIDYDMIPYRIGKQLIRVCSFDELFSKKNSY